LPPFAAKRQGARVATNRPAEEALMTDTPQDMIDAARRAAAVRAQLAFFALGGIGAPGVPLIRPGLTTVFPPASGLAAIQERAHQFAIRIFDEDDPDMDEVARLVGKIRDRLSTPNFPIEISGPDDTLCTVRRFGGYVLNNRPPVHFCARFFSEPDDVAPGELNIPPEEQRIRTLLHETAHLIGIGQPAGESYYTAFDGCPIRGNGLGANAADSWAHFIHAVSGQPLDTAAVVITPNTPVPAGPPATPATGPTMYTVVPGDFLSKIAKKFYGDSTQWPKIYNANKTKIGPNPNKIFPGQVLIIPDV
jgi:hypothetical protein